MNLRITTLALSLVASSVLAEDCRFHDPKASAAKVQALAQEASHTNPCITVPGLTAKSLSTVWAAFISGPKTGGKRFDTVPPAGSPTGKVLASAEGVLFDLRSVATEGVQALQVFSQGGLVFDVATPGQPMVFVPPERLAPGKSYEWQLKTRANLYRGRFELATAEDVAAVQERLRALQSAGLSAPLRSLYAAAVYDAADLYIARDQELATLRALTGQGSSRP